MSRKKLLKLGISILALNALGVATYHVAPDLYEIKTVHAEEPGEDEEIPDAAERSIAFKFRDKLNDLEVDFNDFKKNPSDEEEREFIQEQLDDVINYYGIAKKAMKSEVGKKFFAPLEERYHTLKAKVEAALNGKTEEPTTPKVEHQEITTKEPVPYPSRTEYNATLPEGTRNVKQAGVNGEKTVVWDITLTDGKETARTKKSENVTKQPVEEIIEVGTKKAAVETKENVTVEEKVPFKEETKVDPALDKGKTRVEEGEEGIDEVTYEVTKVDGKETARKEVSRKTKKAPKNKVTYTGSKAVITTKEVTRTEEVAFTSREVENAMLAEGVRRVKTAGQKGVRTIVETVTYTDGVETSRVVKSNVITTAPVEEVIEVGTKKNPVITTKDETRTEEVAFQTKEVTNPDLAEGVRQVKVAGQKGVRTIVETVTYADGVETGRVVKSDDITTAPVDEVIEVGAKKLPVITTKDETRTEEVAFQTTEVANPDLAEGVRQVKVAGQKGVRTIVETVTYTDGVETGRVVKSNVITTAPVDEVIEVGAKKLPVVTTKDETRTEEVAFQTTEVANPDLAEGVRQVKVAGQKGVRTIVETVTYTDGVETGRVVKSNVITTAPVDEVIEVGAKKLPVVTTKDETRTEEVAFQTTEVANPDLAEGVRQVKVAGQKGVRTIVETVTYTDGVETGRVVKSNVITTAPVDEVIEVGAKKLPVVTTKDETRTEEVAFQTKEVTNTELPEGTREVKAAGKKGIRTIVETVTYTDGVETGRVVKSSEITTAPVDEIVEVGTKKLPVVTTKDETRTEEVAFQTKEVTNTELPEGTREVKAAGKKGIRTIVETVTYTDGVETGRVVKSNVITTAPVDEVIEVGAKKLPVVTTKDETRTEEVAFQTTEVANPDLAEGVRQVKVAGQKGVRTIVETVTYTDGVETGRVVKSNVITTAPVDEVIEVGAKKAAVITTKDETRTEEVAFQTKEVTNAELPEGKREVKAAGKKGVRTIVETVTYTDGVETGRVVKSSEITTAPVDEIVEVGTKKVVADDSNKPVNPGTKPVDPGTKPVDPGTKPVDPGTKPEGPAAKPAPSQDKNTLPNTGSAVSSLLSIIGLAFASLAAFVLRKKD